VDFTFEIPPEHQRDGVTPTQTGIDWVRYAENNNRLDELMELIGRV
jgi:hypothetical protein